MKKGVAKKMLIFLFCVILTGCSNVTGNSAQTNNSNRPAETSGSSGLTLLPDESAVEALNEEKSDLRGIAYNGNGVYVIVGSKGMVLTSGDGLTWIPRQSGTDRNLSSVIWGKEQFVSVGDEGTLLVSSDGVTWEKVNSNINSYFYKVRWEDNLYIAMGSGTVLASEDGNGWTKKEVPLFQLNNAADDKFLYGIEDMLWDGKQYIAVGDGNFILTSKMLDQWDVRVPSSRGTGMFCSVEWNGSRYVAVGDHLAMSTSLDGHQWIAGGLKINDIENVDDYYTLCLNSIAWGQDKFIAVGQKGLILESKDGLEWSVLSSHTIAGLNQVLWDGRQFIAVGDNDTVVRSTDGAKWVEIRN